MNNNRWDGRLSLYLHGNDNTDPQQESNEANGLSRPSTAPLHLSLAAQLSTYPYTSPDLSFVGRRRVAEALSRQSGQGATSVSPSLPRSATSAASLYGTVAPSLAAAGLPIAAAQAVSPVRSSAVAASLSGGVLAPTAAVGRPAVPINPSVAPPNHPRGLDSTTFQVSPRDLEDLHQLPALRERVRRHTEDVIACLPQHLTGAYREAMRRAPDLVRTETDPLQFIRYCNYNMVEGAKRLCSYWTERLALFGPQRAFLPLTLTGTGALTPEDLISLRAGFPVLLPLTAHSSKQFCLLLDRRKRVAGTSFEQIFRCFFYMFKLVAEDTLTQLDGAYCFIVSITPRTEDHNNNLIQGLASLTTRIFPVKLKFHLLSLPNQMRQTVAAELVESLTALLKRHFRVGGQDPAVQTYVEREPGDILESLKKIGFSPQGIPYFVGGEWKFEDFSDWCKERVEMEKTRYKNRLLKDAPGITDWSKFNRTNVALPSSSSPSSTLLPGGSSSSTILSPNTITSTTGKTPRPHLHNDDTTSPHPAIHATVPLCGTVVPPTGALAAQSAGHATHTNLQQQRMGHGTSISGPAVAAPAAAAVAMSDHGPRTVAAAKAARTPPRRKAAPTKKAAAEDADLTEEEAALAQQRKREERVAKRKMADMLYSRRKREREYIMVQQLKEQSSALRREQQTLRSVQERLTALLAEAEACVAHQRSSTIPNRMEDDDETEDDDSTEDLSCFSPHDDKLELRT